MEDWKDINLIVSTASAQPVSIVRPNPYYVNTFQATMATSGYGGGAIGGAMRSVAEDFDNEGEEEMLMADVMAVEDATGYDRSGASDSYSIGAADSDKSFQSAHDRRYRRNCNQRHPTCQYVLPRSAIPRRTPAGCN